MAAGSAGKARHIDGRSGDFQLFAAAYGDAAGLRPDVARVHDADRQSTRLAQRQTPGFHTALRAESSAGRTE